MSTPDLYLHDTIQGAITYNSRDTTIIGKWHDVLRLDLLLDPRGHFPPGGGLLASL